MFVFVSYRDASGHPFQQFYKAELFNIQTLYDEILLEFFTANCF